MSKIEKPKLTLRQKLRDAASPKRNKKCPCGSGLKVKQCHGDVAKIQMVQQVSQVVFLRLVEAERFKVGMSTEREFRDALKKLEYKVVDIPPEDEPEDTPEPVVERERDPEAFRKLAGLDKETK